MKKNLILIILIIMPTLSYAENKNYFQFEYGESKLDSGISVTAGTPSIDEKDKSFGITYGYNLKNSNTFLEFGYIDLGSYSVKGKNGDGTYGPSYTQGKDPVESEAYKAARYVEIKLAIGHTVEQSKPVPPEPETYKVGDLHVNISQTIKDWCVIFCWFLKWPIWKWKFKSLK